MVEIVLATRNKKKIEEIKRAIGNVPISILTIDDFPGCPEVQEEGVTFQENAIKKALAVAQYTGKPSLADDSGLEVYALNNAPEHAQMRSLLDQMGATVAALDTVGFSGNAETLLIMMQQHNLKEENILYPMCDQALACDVEVEALLRQAIETATEASGVA